ncbi:MULTISPECIES: DUF397 domain-containing protein [Nocardia]|uniref:DUF397 domain-containing protein n=1 Tax=Nocardia TaxID=1817 RepID=UPI001893143C|nr:MULTISPECIES: DUF397 domain-containing protein [Nocardia]MBF6349012.1 DUF397 domain-containing protein [Nocardia flavorosea]
MRADLSGANWFKSSHSQHGGDCVEVAHTADAVGVRDSKNSTGPALVFGAGEWAAFLRAISAGS